MHQPWASYIHVIGEDLTRKEMVALYLAADAYVTASMAEYNNCRWRPQHLPADPPWGGAGMEIVHLASAVLVQATALPREKVPERFPSIRRRSRAPSIRCGATKVGRRMARVRPKVRKLLALYEVRHGSFSRSRRRAHELRGNVEPRDEDAVGAAMRSSPSTRSPETT